MTKASKKQQSDEPEEAPVLRFFNPDGGEVEAKDINEAVEKIVKLQKQKQEGGDGDR